MDIEVEVRPTAVTVFPDRAQVTCAGDCELEAGAHKLLLGNLPLALDPDSVRVTGAGSAQVRIASVDVSRQFFTEPPQTAVRELTDQIETLTADLRAVADEKAGWEAHGRYLEGMRQATQAYAKGLAKGQMGVSEQARVATFLREQDQEMRAAIRVLDQQADALNKQLEKAQQQLDQLRNVRPKQQYQAAVEMEAVSAGAFAVEISYVVRQASWQPLYDVRLMTISGVPTIHLTMLAQISQQTGQAWTAVSLSVSTARPALNQRLPELNPWYIDVAPPIMPRQAAKRDMLMSADVAEAVPQPAAMMAQAMPVAAEHVVAEVSGSDTAVRFQVSGHSDIPNDGSPHKTTLALYEWTPKIDYMAVPKHTDAVFRRAKVQNRAGAPLLAGAANLFVNDAFIGHTQLEYTPDGDELELLLGVEERITIERELTKREVDKKLLRDQRRIRYGYRLKVHNVLATAVAVQVADHIPVSRHEQIRIRLESVSPPPSEQSDLNELTWQLQIGAQETAVVTYEFTVEHPRDMRVVRLP